MKSENQYDVAVIGSGHNGLIPGHDGDVRFLNVADLAMKLFDVRRNTKR